MKMANNDSRYPEIEILKKDFCNPKFIQSLTRKQAAQEKKEKECIAEVKTKEYMNWLVNTVKVNGYVSDSPSFRRGECGQAPLMRRSAWRAGRQSRQPCSRGNCR